jgi:hypothetical protein
MCTIWWKGFGEAVAILGIYSVLFHWQNSKPFVWINPAVSVAYASLLGAKAIPEKYVAIYYYFSSYCPGGII